VEDLVQETFMRVFRALPLFEGQAKLSTWICTIAHRVAIDHVRRTGRTREETLVEAYEAEGATPETSASSEEIRCLVQSGIGELPDKYRLPLVYAAIDGLDYGTIAAMLDVPVGTVKTLVFRGKQQLKSWILKQTTR
jgi:RNA polymerase sigma factor (sigma-70 family)